MVASPTAKLTCSIFSVTSIFITISIGWVQLTQCHDNLDAVPRAQITFREGFVRDLKLATTARVSMAFYNTREEIDAVVLGLKKVREVFV